MSHNQFVEENQKLFANNVEIDKNGIYLYHSDAIQNESSLEGYDTISRILDCQQGRNWIHLYRIMHAVNFIQKNFKDKDMNVAELGCGYAEIPRFLQTLSTKLNYFAMDADYRKLESASKKKIGNFNRVLMRADLSRAELPFKDEALDGIVSIEFIEHIELDRGMALMIEANRCLKLGGKMLITTPNVRNSDKIEAYHIFEYEYNEFVEFLKLCGFEIYASYGMSAKENILKIDKKNENNKLHNALRSFLPSSMVKTLVSLDDPDGARAFVVHCKKIKEPNLDAIDAFDFAYSKERNGKQMLRNPNWKKYSQDKQK